MGIGASCTNAEQTDENMRVQSMSPRRRGSNSSISSQYMRPPAVVVPSKFYSEEDGFKVKRNVDPYSSVWDCEAKLTPAIERTLKKEFGPVGHHQKETMETKWSGNSSADFETTHVQSILNSRTHSCINLSTSQEIDELMDKLNNVHKNYDETVKRRSEQISNETENVLSHILNETHQEQQQLLQYAKQQQLKQEEYYRDLLQKYIAQLDDMKAKELTKLQDELDQCREQIMQISQMKIMSVNEQANMMKSKIVRDEQQQASKKIDNINFQLHKLTGDNTFQQFGRELFTQFNVTTNANVGKKNPDNSCTFNYVKEVPKEIIQTTEELQNINTDQDMRTADE